MGSIVKTLFGGTDTSSQEAQIQQNEQARRTIAAAQAQARQDAMSLFPAAAANRNLGFQSALDVFGQTIPGQLDVFQQGNVGAQQAILAGLPQAQNAILGLPVDFGAFQPQRLDVNTQFAQQQLPQFQQPQLAPAGQPPGGIPQFGGGFGGGGVPQGQQLPGGINIQQLLAGRG